MGVEKPLALWSVVLLLVACGRDQRGRSDSSDGETNHYNDIPRVELAGTETVSGDRLVRLVWVSDDGADALTDSFYDKERGERCRFRFADDGELRCLPERMILGEVMYDGSTPRNFADPTCEDPVVLPGTMPSSLLGEAPPLYGSPMSESSCGGIAVYELGRLLEGPWYAHHDGECIRGSALLFGQRLGARVANRKFARAELFVEGRGALRAHRLNAEDGTAMLHGFWDAVLSEPCHLEFLDASHYVCAPSGAVDQTWFSCPELSVCFECTERVFLAENACQEPRWGLSGVLGKGTSVHAMEPWSAETDYDESTATCIEAAQGFSDAPLFIVGEKHPSNSFPELKRYFRRGGAIASRFVRHEETGLELSTPISEGLRDRWSEQDCWLHLASDGKVRCFPHTYRSAAAVFYADPECTEPLFDASDRERLTEQQGALLSRGGTTVRETDRDGVTRVYQWGEPYDGPRYSWEHFHRLGNCQLDESGWGDSIEWVTAGLEISPTRFVAYELKTVDE